MVTIDLTTPPPPPTSFIDAMAPVYEKYVNTPELKAFVERAAAPGTKGFDRWNSGITAPTVAAPTMWGRRLSGARPRSEKVCSGATGCSSLTLQR